MARDASDEDLMLRYRDGDAAAFEALYARHKGGLYRYILRQCGNWAHAEELFQEVWMSLIRARNRYRVEAKFATYLYRVAHNRVIDYYRREKGRVPFSFDEEDCAGAENIAAGETDQPERQAAGREQAARLLEALARLPEAQREAFLLHEEGGLSVEEIAAATGVDREAAKSRLRYALAKLRESLRETL